MKSYVLLFFLLLFLHCSLPAFLLAQRANADSIKKLLATEKVDTNRVRMMWQIADYTNSYAPDSALSFAENALFLSRRLQYKEGESRSLGIIANIFLAIGNYSKALEYYLMKLQLEEQGNNPRNLASVIMNIGIVYAYESEYELALQYYMKADSIIQHNNVDEFKYNIVLNIGDFYERIGKTDSAFFYYDLARQRAFEKGSNLNVAIAQVGVANTYRKLNQNEIAIEYFHEAIPELKKANEDDILCQAYFGLAQIFELQSKLDSAKYYANLSLQLAEKDEFLSRQLEAAEFLARLSQESGNMHGAINFLNLSQVLKDSIYSKEKIRETIILSVNEQERQLKLNEEQRQAEELRSHRLQYLLICIFIPLIFMLSLWMSRKRINARMVRFLGVISLLFMLEFFTLLLHPKVADIANNNPIIELLFFVAFASVMVPAHHRIEHWMIQKLSGPKMDDDITELEKEEPPI